MSYWERIPPFTKRERLLACFFALVLAGEIWWIVWMTGVRWADVVELWR
jgi:hypothetical protein